MTQFKYFPYFRFLRKNAKIFNHHFHYFLDLSSVVSLVLGEK